MNGNDVMAGSLTSGPGLDNVMVQIIADPKAKHNSAKLLIEGDFGKLKLDLFNKPTANPRTSKLSYMSIIAALERRSGNYTFPA